MRTAFIDSLLDIAAADPRVWLVCGDLGYSVLERFAGRFPARFVNVGVAEQNMTGLAAGLALSGKVVFTYSIANFPVMRCLEQIRNDVCYHRLDVKIVAVGGGLSYGAAGYTHHGVEDLAVMKAMPSMTVLAPADPVETRAVMKQIVVRSGPCYLRLGKAGEPVLHASELEQLTIGQAVVVREGSDVSIVSTGGALQLALQAAEELGKARVSARVVSMPTLEPIDREAIVSAATETRAIVCVEEHGPGGLAASVAEVMATTGCAARLGIVRLSGEPLTKAGSQAQLRAREGVTAEAVAAVATRLVASCR